MTNIELRDFYFYLIGIKKVKNKVDFAKRLDYIRQYVTEVVNGTKNITPEFATRVQSIFRKEYKEYKTIREQASNEDSSNYKLPNEQKPYEGNIIEENAKDIGQPIGTHTIKTGNQFIELTGGLYLMYTKLVPIKAHAGYLVGWGDDEFIEELPIHPIVVKELHRGTYRTFEATGDSMNDGTSDAIEPGDYVTGRQINRNLWKSKFHLKKFPDYIIVHRIHGIMIKRITEHNTEAGTITCHSLNPDKEKYADFKVNLDDCIQIFNVLQITKKR